MSLNNSLVDSASLKAELIQKEVLELAKNINLDELYQVKSRMITSVNNLSKSVRNAFDHNNRLERIRSFVLITGKMLECKDYLQLLSKLQIAETNYLSSEIDDLTYLLMVNSGSLN